ncbi:hypothetical protein NMD70_09735 [Edwardsiella tarda]|uniref:hypothetical protein n=1 Tax=Edwardsiella tarda TaxID=636 RepID=UPI00351C6136
MSQPSNEQLFILNYCHYLEAMTEILNRRCERTICFFQFLLGSAVFAQSSYGWLFGGLVATCAAITYAWNPGKIAANARKQAFRYQQLLNEVNNLTSEELQQKTELIEQDDSSVCNLLLNPARCRAYISLGWPCPEKLTTIEKIIATWAGGIPR